MTNDDIIKKAISILEERAKYAEDITVTQPDTIMDLLKLRYRLRQAELFGVVWLDNRHRVIKIAELFNGTIDGASVHAREVVKSALAHNAAAAILFHNHPSGNSSPSQADQRITARIKDALALIDVRTLDHIIIGEEPYSFANSGLI